MQSSQGRRAVLPVSGHSHRACLDDHAVPVNLVLRKLWTPSEGACSLQGLLGGSGVPSSSLPAQNHTAARLAAQKQIHRGDLKTEGTAETPSHTCLSSPVNNLSTVSGLPNIHLVSTGRETTERLLLDAHPGQALITPSASKSLQCMYGAGTGTARDRTDAYWRTLKEVSKHH